MVLFGVQERVWDYIMLANGKILILIIIIKFWVIHSISYSYTHVTLSIG